VPVLMGRVDNSPTPRPSAIRPAGASEVGDGIEVTKTDTVVLVRRALVRFLPQKCINEAPLSLSSRWRG
jgi:hypothetical protein